MMAKVKLDFSTLSARIHDMDFPEVDVVIGIGTGGIVPASLIAFHLRKDLEIIQFNYRDENNSPRYSTPRLLSDLHRDYSGKRILLVDDVSVSGKTLEEAQGLFSESVVTTCVMKGKADFNAFPEIESCVIWPWKF
jgi:hypoxanthine phosphoribosyltransferase